MLESLPGQEHGVSAIKVVTKGRVTGLPHIVELRYVLAESRFLVIGASASSDWILNALASGEAKVRTGDFVILCRARRATEHEKEWVTELFVRKYGSRVVNQWYRGASFCLSLEPVGRAGRRGAVRGESGTETDFGSWKSLRRDYYSDVAEAFDSASEEYDFTISRNFINTWIRKRSLQILFKHLRREDVALEIGCGTGAETVQIARAVKGIVATDISAGMVSLLKAKLRAKRLASIAALRLGAAEISEASRYLEGGKTRVAYSLNGALNCEPRLDEFVRGLSSLLEDGGYFICSIRNRLCLTEALSHALVFQFDRMNPRKKQPTMVSVGGRDIPSLYYSPSEFASRFERRFAVRDTIALPCLLPPAYLSSYYLKLRDIASPLERLETALADKPVFNRLGDQTLFVFQKK